MTRKDYKLIAEIIMEIPCFAGDKENPIVCDFQQIIETFAKKLEQENPAFNRSKFISACEAA